MVEILNKMLLIWLVLRQVSGKIKIKMRPKKQHWILVAILSPT